MTVALTKARLVELKDDLTTERSGGKAIDVQFNPDTMKMTYANQFVQPASGDQAAGTSGRQFVGAGTTKLALTLWFDVTAMTEKPVDDVRRLTRDVIYFITPKPAEADATKLSPPGLSFRWGSFKFDGLIEGLEETLEFFSPEGKPLRANIGLSLSQQKILVAKFAGDGRVTGRPGQRPFTPARQGDSLQGMIAAAGKGGWQGIAAGNGIEDPLRIAPGRLIDLGVSAAVGGSFGVAPPRLTLG